MMQSKYMWPWIMQHFGYAGIPLKTIWYDYVSVPSCGAFSTEDLFMFVYSKQKLFGISTNSIVWIKCANFIFGSSLLLWFLVHWFLWNCANAYQFSGRFADFFYILCLEFLVNWGFFEHSTKSFFACVYAQSVSGCKKIYGFISILWFICTWVSLMLVQRKII